MGMNLYVMEMPSEKSVGWFDCSRFSMDGDFADAEFEKDIECPDETYCIFRPKNFNEARKWVRDNIPWEGNETRLINALNRMEKNSSIWFAYF